MKSPRSRANRIYEEYNISNDAAQAIEDEIRAAMLEAAEAVAEAMRDKAENTAYAERIRSTNERDRIYNRACLDCTLKIRDLDASIVAQEVVARRAVDAEGGG